jgi:uncharacterized membrane protein
MIVLATAVVLLSFPSTLQFLVLRFDNHYYHIDSKAMEVTKYLENTLARSVVLHPNNNGGLSLASNLAGRWSVISPLHSHVTEHIGFLEAAGRAKDVEFFFDFQKNVNRSSILKKYNVDYIYLPLEYDFGFNKEIMANRVLKNQKYVVYKVDRGKK